LKRERKRRDPNANRAMRPREPRGIGPSQKIDSRGHSPRIGQDPFTPTIPKGAKRVKVGFVTYCKYKRLPATGVRSGGGYTPRAGGDENEMHAKELGTASRYLNGRRVCPACLCKGGSRVHAAARRGAVGHNPESPASIPRERAKSGFNCSLLGRARRVEGRSANASDP